MSAATDRREELDNFGRRPRSYEQRRRRRSPSYEEEDRHQRNGSRHHHNPRRSNSHTTSRHHSPDDRREYDRRRDYSDDEEEYHRGRRQHHPRSSSRREPDDDHDKIYSSEDETNNRGSRDRHRSSKNNHNHNREENDNNHRRHHHDRRENTSNDRPVPPNVGDIVQGSVVRLEKYGAFFEWPDQKIEGFVHRGLIHISELAEERIRAVEDVVRVDDTIYARVINVEPGSFKINLSLRGVDTRTGEAQGPPPPPKQSFHHNNNDRDRRGSNNNTHPRRRAQQRDKLMQRVYQDVSWRQEDDNPQADPGMLRLLYSASPKLPDEALFPKSKKNTGKKGKSTRRDESSSEEEKRSDEDSSSSESSSTSSEEERRRRRRRRRKDRGRSSKSRRKRRRRRYSSSSSSSDNDSSSSGSDSDASSRGSDNEQQHSGIKRTEEEDMPHVDGAGQQTMDSDTIPPTAKAVQPPDDESDDDSVGPRPPPASGDQGDMLAMNNAAGGDYGKALLPGEGQAIAQYVQQNLRVPRRGEIGYNADEIDHYEKSGYVMSGSRHARMNAVRIRKENQVYTAEEQRALALLTIEENKKKEAALMDEFKEMLAEKQRAKNGAK